MTACDLLATGFMAMGSHETKPDGNRMILMATEQADAEKNYEKPTQRK
jgi:hypothetical protein